MYHNTALLLTIALIFAVCCSGLDVSFIPNDENEPLPQSKKYRDTLRKLCVLIRTEGAILPPEVEKQKPVLEKVCLKLQKDDENIEGGMAEAKASSPKQVLLYLLIGAGSGYYLWSNRGWLKKTINGLLNKRGTTNAGVAEFRGGAAQNGGGGGNIATIESSASSHSSFTHTGATTTISSGNIIHSTPIESTPVDPAKVAEARAARLKRFAAMNAVGTNIAASE